MTSQHHFTELQSVPMTDEDRECGVFVSIKVNGTMLKLVKCSTHCNIVHVYAVDPQLFDFQFDYEYEETETREHAVNAITQRLVNMQAACYLEQKAYMKAQGTCVNH